MCVCVCVYRYVRIVQTRGKEGFKLQLESCSYVGPVPYNFRDLGVIGQLYTFPTYIVASKSPRILQLPPIHSQP